MKLELLYSKIDRARENDKLLNLRKSDSVCAGGLKQKPYARFSDEENMGKIENSDGFLDEEGFDRSVEGYFVEGIGLGADYKEQKIAGISRSDSYWSAMKKIGILREKAQIGDKDASSAQSPGWLRVGEKNRTRIPGAAALKEIEGNAWKAPDPRELKVAKISIGLAQSANKKIIRAQRTGWKHTILRTIILLSIMAFSTFYIAGARSFDDARKIMVKRAISLALRLPDGAAKTISKNIVLNIGKDDEIPEILKVDVK